MRRTTTRRSIPVRADAVKLKPIGAQVVVITGASSGIGRATAIMAAARGATVVIAARNQQALDTLADEIAASGGRAVAIVCDVSDPDPIQHLADETIARCGRIDAWVNNAGVAIAARLEDLPLADARRLFDVNFWGVVNGSLAALPHLEAQGGALINLGSFTSDVAAPYMGMYSASKAAIKGYTDALRIELLMDRRPISVTLIKPAPIATPVLQHQRNLLDHQATMPPPFYRPEDVARTILYAAEHPVRDCSSAARPGSAACSRRCCQGSPIRARHCSRGSCSRRASPRPNDPTISMCRSRRPRPRAIRTVIWRGAASIRRCARGPGRASRLPASCWRLGCSAGPRAA